MRDSQKKENTLILSNSFANGTVMKLDKYYQLNKCSKSTI